jgi:hypothetical protein
MNLVVFVHPQHRVLWTWQKQVEGHLVPAPLCVASFASADAVLSHNRVAVVVCELSPAALRFCSKFDSMLPPISFLAVPPAERNETLERAHIAKGSRFSLGERDPKRLVLQIQRELSGADTVPHSEPLLVTLREALLLARDSSGTRSFRVEAHGRCGHLIIDDGQIVDASRGRGSSREAAFDLCNWEDASVSSMVLQQRRGNRMRIPLRVFLDELDERDCGRETLIRDIGRIYLEKLVEIPHVTRTVLIDLDNLRALALRTSSTCRSGSMRIVDEAINLVAGIYAHRGMRLQPFEGLSLALGGCEVVIRRINATLGIMCIADVPDTGPALRIMTARIALQIRDQLIKPSTRRFGVPESRIGGLADGTPALQPGWFPESMTVRQSSVDRSEDD